MSSTVGSLDFSWDYTIPGYWTTIEINFAIICACFMTFKPLIVRVFPSLDRRRRSSSDGERFAVLPGGVPPTIGSKPTKASTPDTPGYGFLSASQDTDIHSQEVQGEVGSQSVDEKSVGVGSSGEP